MGGAPTHARPFDFELVTVPFRAIWRPGLVDSAISAIDGHLADVSYIIVESLIQSDLQTYVEWVISAANGN